MLIRTLTATAALTLIATSALAAGVYKCTDPATGAVTISQFQCAPDAAPVEVRVHTPTAEQSRASQEKWNAIFDQQTAERRQRDIAREQARQREIERRMAAQPVEKPRTQRVERVFVYNGRLHGSRMHDDHPLPRKNPPKTGGGRINGTGVPTRSLKP